MNTNCDHIDLNVPDDINEPINVNPEQITLASVDSSYDITTIGANNNLINVNVGNVGNVGIGPVNVGAVGPVGDVTGLSSVNHVGVGPVNVSVGQVDDEMVIGKPVDQVMIADEIVQGIVNSQNDMFLSSLELNPNNARATQLQEFQNKVMEMRDEPYDTFKVAFKKICSDYVMPYSILSSLNPTEENLRLQKAFILYHCKCDECPSRIRFIVVRHDDKLKIEYVQGTFDHNHDLSVDFIRNRLKTFYHDSLKEKIKENILKGITNEEARQNDPEIAALDPKTLELLKKTIYRKIKNSDKRTIRKK